MAGAAAWLARRKIRTRMATCFENHFARQSLFARARGFLHRVARLHANGFDLQPARHRFGFSATNYGALLSLNGVMVVFCELPITTFITQRFPPRRMMALGYLLTGTGFAINAFARTLPVMTLAVLIFTLGEIVSVPVSAAYVADLAPEQFRGRYSGA